METKQLSVAEIKQHARKQILLRSVKWNNRRKMAYISLFSILIVTYWCFFEISDERVKSLENIVSWFFITMGSVVGAYMGFSTLDDNWTKVTRNEKKNESEE